jgi:hypothetical protein
MHIKALFNPPPPLPHVPGYKQQLGAKKPLPYTGVSEFLKHFESAEEYEDNFAKFKPIEQRKEKKERLVTEREEMNKEILTLKQQTWNPQDYTFDTDAYKTLFVGRLSFLTDELKLKREMEQVSFGCLVQSLLCVCVFAKCAPLFSFPVLYVNARAPHFALSDSQARISKSECLHLRLICSMVPSRASSWWRTRTQANQGVTLS